MGSDRISVKFLESFACSHLSDDFFENEGWDMMNYIMQSKGSPIPKIKDLKDRGNNLYKQNSFGAAVSCYDDACKLLSLVVSMEDSYDTNLLSDLAVSLNLNLAACALKLFEHEASKDHCSIVLSFFPKNVKALFRRGLSFMKLNKFLDAKSDLEAALLVEPRNKDIIRELDVVKNYLAINVNGKRRIDEYPMQNPNENGKQVHDDEPPLKNLRESGSDSDSISRHGLTSYQDININLYGGSLIQSTMTEKSGMEIDSDKLVSDRQSCYTDGSSSTSEVSCNFEDCTIANSPDENGLNINLNGDSHGAEKKFFRFTKKSRGFSVLKIDAGTYKKLLDAKEVSFFQKSHLSTLKIRVLKPCIKECDTGYTPHKKKRKRRKSTKRLRASNPIMADSTKNDVLQLSPVAPNNPIELDHPLEEDTSSLSWELVNNQTLGGGLSHDNSRQSPFFIFTASKSKVAKAFHARRQLTRIQSRKEESPRRNVYIYPGKFPRSRNVSVLL